MLFEQILLLASNGGRRCCKTLLNALEEIRNAEVYRGEDESVNLGDIGIHGIKTGCDDMTL
jgi:hypothetical protein